MAEVVVLSEKILGTPAHKGNEITRGGLLKSLIK